MYNRNIFTDSKPSRWETLADYTLSLAIALALTMAALAFFDIL
jgi:hypothetical protein